MQFRLAAVQVPILGVDFLRARGLVINVRDRTMSQEPLAVGLPPIVICGLPSHAPHIELFRIETERCIHSSESCRCIREVAPEATQDQDAPSHRLRRLLFPEY